MDTIGAFEAKTKLGELLDRVEAGEEIVISRRGRQVAKLVPLSATPDAAERLRAARDGLEELRRDLARSAGRVSAKTFRRWIEEGRRF